MRRDAGRRVPTAPGQRLTPGRRQVLVVGNLYCDMVFYGLEATPVLGEEIRTERFAITPGGAAFITAAGLARLGVRTAVRAYVGRDLLGRFQLDALRRAGLDVAQVARHPRLGAAVTVVFSTRSDRGFITYTGCAADTRNLVRVRHVTAMRGARHVHFAGVPRPFGERLRVFDRLRGAGVSISVDIGWNPAAYGEPGFREVLRRATVFLPSWKDARWLTGRRTPEDAVRALGEFVPVPVIKLGARGAVGLEHGRPVRVRAPRVAAVDTTGAGDAFNAGFLWSYLRDDPLRRCLLAGNICGALSTRAPGGTAAFPRRREVAALLEELSP